MTFNTTFGPNSVDQALALIFTNYDPALVSQTEKQALAQALNPRSPSFSQRQIRLGFQTFSNTVPTALRLAALKVMRRARNTTRVEMKRADQCSFNQLVLRLDEQGLTRRQFDGQRSVVCLSYDVDRLVGYNYLEELVGLLVERGLSATFNILTNWEYELSWDKIEAMQAAGMDIGLHGGKHDIGLGYRRKGQIERELRGAVSTLPQSLRGYRAPALSMTPTLMDTIVDLGFAYDSSLPMTNMYYKSTESCFPYPSEDVQIWEMPVTLQDSTLFLDLKLNEAEAAAKIVENVEEVAQIGGISIINLHPYVVVEKVDFHKHFLDYLSNASNIAVWTQQRLFDYIQAVVSQPA